MARPLLPPTGVYVPTCMIYNTKLPPVILQTWIQLRGLAWGDIVTPCMQIKEMASIIGKSPATLYRHMAQLRDMAALSWRTTGLGSIIVSFYKQPSIDDTGNPQSTILNSQNRESQPPPGDYQPAILNSQNREMPSPPSLNPPVISDPLLIPVIEPVIQESDQNPYDNVKREEMGEGACEGGRGFSNLQNCARENDRTFDHSNVTPPASDAVSAYRSLSHLSPNLAQRRILESKVTNLPLWQQTVEHWLSHGWNPMNIAGMLEMYARGGPSDCRYCHTNRKPAREAKTAQEYTHNALEDLCQELGIPTPSDEP